MADYKGKGFDSLILRGCGFSVSLFVIVVISIRNFHRQELKRKYQYSIAIAIRKHVFPTWYVDWKRLLEDDNKGSSCPFYAECSDFGKCCDIPELLYPKCSLRLLSILNSVMIASEQNNTVVLTEIDLWPYVHVASKYFL